MSRYLILLTIAAAGGCANADSTQAERDTALRTYVSCLSRAAPTYDDNKSDAATIGVVLNNVCRSDFQNWLQVSGKGLSGDAKQMYFQRMERRGPELATQVVLKNRAARN